METDYSANTSSSVTISEESTPSTSNSENNKNNTNNNNNLTMTLRNNDSK